MPSRQKSQPSGTSPAVSSTSFRARMIASVMASMAREIVGRHTPDCSPITACTACTTLGCMRIGAALRESLSPRLGGYPSTSSSRKRVSRSANSAVGSPVAYLMMKVCSS